MDCGSGQPVTIQSAYLFRTTSMRLIADCRLFSYQPYSFGIHSENLVGRDGYSRRLRTAIIAAVPPVHARQQKRVIDTIPMLQGDVY